MAVSTLEFFSSSKAKWPKLHAELLCNGVSRQPVKFFNNADTAPERRINPSALRLERTELSVAEVVTHKYRPCRKCAMELVLDHASSLGHERVVPVTFSGQFVPDEVGINAYDWESISDAGRDRLVRNATRMGLEVAWTSCGPVAYGFVSELVADLLERNVRVYRLPAAMASRLGNPEQRVGASSLIELYWMLRNDRPPEVHGEGHDVARMAVALSE
jgi:hypothetical protein